MSMGTQMTEWQLFRLLRQNWRGLRYPDISAYTEFGKKKGKRRVSCYLFSNFFCNIYILQAQMLFSYCFSLPWFLTLSASQQKPARKTRNWAGQGEVWGRRDLESLAGGRGSWQREVHPEDTPHPSGAIAGCSCQPSAVYNLSEWLPYTINISFLNVPTWWEFSEKIRYNKMQTAHHVWKCP